METTQKMALIDGTKVGQPARPLSNHAKELMREMLDRALPLSQVNCGVRDKLRREGLAEIVQRRSPFAAHRGGYCDHLTLTAKGQEMARTL